MSGAPSHAQQQFRKLLKRIEKERGHGWQTALARELGVHQTMLSKIADGDREAGLALVEAAIEVGIADRDYFFAPARGDKKRGAERVERDEGVLRIVQEMIDSLDPKERAEYDAHDVEWGVGLANTDFTSRIGVSLTAMDVYRWWQRRVAERAGRAAPARRTDVEMPANVRPLGRRSKRV